MLLRSWFELFTIFHFCLLSQSWYKTNVMAGPLLGSCCRCQPLRTGAIISGVGAILLAIVALVVLFTSRVDFHTIIFDWLPRWIVKIILAVNLSMTILISMVMILGVLKVYSFTSRKIYLNNTNLTISSIVTEKSLFDAAVGRARLHVGHLSVYLNHLHDGHVHNWGISSGRSDLGHSWTHLLS